MKKRISEYLELETDLQNESTHPIVIMSTLNSKTPEIVSLTFLEARKLKDTLVKHLDHLSKKYGQITPPSERGVEG